jgi:hypothetical protein
MIATGLRACAAGAWAAVMLALAVTGPQWAFTPWTAAAVLGTAAVIWYVLGAPRPRRPRLFDAHRKRGVRVTRRERKERISDSEERLSEAQEAWNEMLAGYRPLAIGPPVEHSVTWGEPRTDVIGYDAEHERLKADFLAAVERDKKHPPRVLPMPVSPPHVSGWIPEEHDPGCPCVPCTERRTPVVTVTDNPPLGKHEKPRTYLVHRDPEPYCVRCGSGEHWTQDHAGPDPLVTQMVADRAASRAQQAIDDDLRAAGLKVYDGGEDDALKSMWTRAMGLAIADVEAARR